MPSSPAACRARASPAGSTCSELCSTIDLLPTFARLAGGQAPKDRIIDGREAVTAVFLSPLMIPSVVLGVSFLRFFNQIGLSGTFIGITLAHVIMVMPYAIRLVLASVTGMPRDAEQAAATLGASNWTVFRRITLPLILPGIAGGWLLAFITSFDEVTMSIFVASPQTMTLPVRMYHHIAQTIDPLIAAISTLLMVGTVALLVLLDRLYGLDRVLVGKG